MQAKVLRAAVVGASSLLGKELADQMASAVEQSWDVTLLDTGDAGGQFAAAGEEAMVVQSLEPGAFERMDVVFFTGDGETARKHWREAQSSGAAVVDLTGALQKDGVAQVLAPAGGAAAGAERVVAPVHPAALMLAGLALPLRKFGDLRLAATVLVPASEWGAAGIDDLQKQTVGLLSLRGVPTEGVFDEQVAFNLTTHFGAEATASLSELTTTIERDFALLASGCTLAMQAVQAPVFHGYTASVFLTTATPVGQDEMRAAAGAGFLHLVAAGESAPTSKSIAGEKGIFASLHQSGGGYWAWLAADNVTLLAQTAIGSARELVGKR